ncbi:MAG: hypothetical protein HC873_00440 [Leptolyngbyaceae cyanobacterium SL_1_1]|nr:hypothetical protein [Leptolyngbyaceae cyanobacterium SL_1_1]
MKIKRPLLVGGLGLTASAWMLNIVQHSIFNETTLLSAIALSSGLWWWQRQRQPLLLDLAGVVDEAAVKTAFAQIDTAIETLAREIETVTSAKMSAIALDSLRSQRQALEPMLNRDTLQLYPELDRLRSGGRTGALGPRRRGDPLGRGARAARRSRASPARCSR